MTRTFVPYLSEDQIEREALALLREYERARGRRVEPPVPVEDVVEGFLKLTLEFDDLHALFDRPRPDPRDTEILGAIFFDDRRIVIDQALDTDGRPGQEPRFRFTLSHEGIGHWLLHRHLFAKEPAQQSLFYGEPVPSVICRTSEAKLRVEWQADYCGACFLMPRHLILDAWRGHFGSQTPKIIRRRDRWEIPGEFPADIKDALRATEQQRDDEALNYFVRPLANRFQVSMTAMRIRLEALGLLHREVPRQRNLPIGV